LSEAENVRFGGEAERFPAGIMNFEAEIMRPEVGKK